MLVSGHFGKLQTTTRTAATSESGRVDVKWLARLS